MNRPSPARRLVRWTLNPFRPLPRMSSLAAARPTGRVVILSIGALPRLLLAYAMAVLVAAVESGLALVLGQTTAEVVTFLLVAAAGLWFVVGELVAPLSRWLTGRDGGADRAIAILMRLAGWLAGQRHAHLREAWTADLYGDPATTKPPPALKRLRLSGGFVVAALRCRLDDAVAAAWRPVDALLMSWHGSRLATLTPVTVAVGLILSHEGFYGLVDHWDSLSGIATAPFLAIKALRAYRKVPAPGRPQRRASSSESEAVTASPPGSTAPRQARRRHGG